MLSRKKPHKQEFAHNFVRIHPLIIYTDLTEYKIVDDLKFPLLHCFAFISMLKTRDSKTIKQYMNSQTFSKLQFRPLLKIFLNSIHIDLSGEKIPSVTVGITRFFLILRKTSNINF